MFCIFDILIYK